jgi:hypothetical protein
MIIIIIIIICGCAFAFSGLAHEATVNTLILDFINFFAAFGKPSFLVSHWFMFNACLVLWFKHVRSLLSFLTEFIYVNPPLPPFFLLNFLPRLL